MNQTDAAYKNLKSLGSFMTTENAAMMYVFHQEYCPIRDLENKRTTSRAMRDIIARCIIRDADFGRVDLLSKVQEIFGDYGIRNVNLFSQLKKCYIDNCKERRLGWLRDSDCVFVTFDQCACGRCRPCM